MRIRTISLAVVTVLALSGCSSPPAAFSECLDKREDLPAIQQDLTEGRSRGVIATPYFLVDGQRLVAGSVEQFYRVLDAELAKAGQ